MSCRSIEIFPISARISATYFHSSSHLTYLKSLLALSLADFFGGYLSGYLVLIGCSEVFCDVLKLLAASKQFPSTFVDRWRLTSSCRQQTYWIPSTGPSACAMSDLEKHESSRDEREGNGVGSVQGLPPDPDAHLTQEEKDKIVRNPPSQLTHTRSFALSHIFLLVNAPSSHR
jgi:hypothetical protein